MDKNCVECLKDSFRRLINDQLTISVEETKNLESEIEEYFNTMNPNLIAPAVSRDGYRIVNRITKIADPFKEIKYESNKQLLDIYDSFLDIVNKSDNKFKTAIRLAISGNIIDYAVCKEFNIFDNINHVLESEFAIDDTETLEAEVSKAQTILYLGDNAGEIVLDKLFLQTIDHPNVYFAVRSKAIQNDITKDDAIQCGMSQYAKVIENGSDAPSTILSECSKEFTEIYKKADLIISKGQGNLEGLEHSKDERIFFLLMIKCQFVANLLGVKKNDFIVKKNDL